MAFLVAERYIQAIGELEQAVRIKPEAETQHLIGDAYQRLGENEKAKQAFQKSLSINPRFIPSLNELGLLYRESGKLELSLRTFQESLRIDPGQANLSFTAARTAWDLDNPALATKLFESAVKIDPTLTHAWLALAFLYHDADRPNDFREAFTVVQIQNPELARKVERELKLSTLPSHQSFRVHDVFRAAFPGPPVFFGEAGTGQLALRSYQYHDLYRMLAYSSNATKNTFRFRESDIDVAISNWIDGDVAASNGQIEEKYVGRVNGLRGGTYRFRYTVHGLPALKCSAVIFHGGKFVSWTVQGTPGFGGADACEVFREYLRLFGPL